MAFAVGDEAVWDGEVSEIFVNISAFLGQENDAAGSVPREGFIRKGYINLRHCSSLKYELT